jgi:hypothetical protein
MLPYSIVDAAARLIFQDLGIKVSVYYEIDRHISVNIYNKRLNSE